MAKGSVVALRASELKELIKKRWVNRKYKTRPIYINGHKGIGKTDIIKQCCVELSVEFGITVEYRNCNLQFMEPPDFLGLPVVTNDDSGQPMTIHARPQLLPVTGFGIWNFDEMNRCHRDNRAGLLTLIQDRNVNGHPLGEGWIMTGTGNPTEADGVTYEVQTFDAALEDRITPVDFKADVDEFIQFMVKHHGERDPVVRWVMSQTDVVDYKGKLRTSPRGLDYLVAAINADGGYKSPTFFNVVAAEIGTEAAHTFQKFLSSPESISAEEILDEFSPLTIEKLKTLEEKGRNDVLNTLVDGVCTNVVNRTKLNKKNLDNIKEYLEAVSAESKASFFLVLGEKSGENTKIYDSVVDHLINCSPKIVEFLKKYEAREDKQKVENAKPKGKK